MAGKDTGLGDYFYIAGYDVSGDVGSLDQLGGGPALGDVTAIDKSAHERLGLLRDGTMQFTTFFNVASGQEHPALSTLPRTDVIACYFHRAVLGNPAAGIVAKQLNYDGTRDNSGNLTFKVQADANAFGLEWGIQHTAGKRTDTTATTGTAIDWGAGFSTPSFPLTTVPVTNTSPLPATVVISSGTVGTVTINGVSAGSGDGTYTVPSGQTIAVAYTGSPTWTWTLSTAFGAQSYLQVFSLTGTSTTVKVRHSADNVTYADLITHTAATGRAFERVAVAGTVNRYTEVVTSGTFSSCVFALIIVRNPVATVF
jgi:hypothetical protein